MKRKRKQKEIKMAEKNLFEEEDIKVQEDLFEEEYIGEFIVDERLKCPHCKKKIGEKALLKAEIRIEAEGEKRAEEEAKLEEKFSETIPVKKRVKHAKEIFGT